MKKSDVICPNCKAGYRRVEIVSGEGSEGVYNCRVCDRVLETFDGSAQVAYRLTVQPVRRSRS
jgi:transposase-like protein